MKECNCRRIVLNKIEEAIYDYDHMVKLIKKDEKDSINLSTILLKMYMSKQMQLVKHRNMLKKLSNKQKKVGNL